MKKLIVLAAVGGLCLALAGGSTAASRALPRLTLALNGKTVQVGGSLQSGAVEVVTTTTGERDGNPVLFRLDPGVGDGQFAAIAVRANQDPNNVSPYGALVFATDAPSGTSSAETVLEPGRYVALDPPQNENSRKVPPHAFFTVRATAHPAALPHPQATIQTVEFAFRGPTTLHPDELVRFQNDGFLAHMALLVQARDHAGAEQIIRLLEAGKDQQAQRLATGFADPLGPVTQGSFVQLNLHVTPGWYVLTCFMDTQDHREHSQLGMVRLVRVTG